MFFWIPATIPLVASLIILISPKWPISKGQGAEPHERADNWKKFGIFFGINLLASFVIAMCMWGGAVSKSYFPEVWNYKITGIKHEMKWTTHETRTETYTTGSGKNKTTHTRTIHYTDTHGPYWSLCDEYGNWVRSNEKVYNEWKKLWGNEKHTDTHKGSSAFGDRSIDGPIYECKWPKTFDTIFPYTKIARYQNKIRVSDSIFKFGEPTEAELAKYPRPADKRNSLPVVSYGGFSVGGDELFRLRRVNASLGRHCQIHTMLVTLNPSDPRSQVESILKAWGGPNKNELVTFIAVKGNEVTFCEVHSWMDNTALHGAIRDALMAEKWSPRNYGNLLLANAPKMWRRKEFTPFTDHLRVPIHPGWMIAGIILALGLAVGVFILVEYKLCPTYGGNSYYRRRPRMPKPPLWTGFNKKRHRW